MIPVCVYVDGFNLYHALRRFGDEKVKWLDLAALCQRLIRPKTEKIHSVYYFSAYADWLPGPMARHEEYVRALEACGIVCVMGHFKKKDRWCSNCSTTTVGHEEKETDVSIGITMLRDAFRGSYQKAYLVTRDSDLMPAVRMVCAEFPAKQIVVVAPPLMGHSNDLIRVCQEKKKISPKQIRTCLLPQVVKRKDGTVAATRPAKYN
jgi:uncharacterized LabA/DUF88 family protein